MASRGDQIIDAIIDQLAIPDDLDTLSDSMQELAAELEGLVVDRYPLRPGEPMRIRVFPFRETVSNEGSATLTVRHLEVKLELLALVTEDLEADQAVDPLYVWAIRRLMADRTLAGTARTLREVERAWGGREGERAHGAELIVIIVDYQTRADNPEERT